MIRYPVEEARDGKIRCNACPVLCYIKEGRAGACDRYANQSGELVRVDPFVILEQANDPARPVVPFLAGRAGTSGPDADAESVAAADADARVEGEPVAVEADAEAIDNADAWNGDIIQGNRPFVTAIGAGTTYPDYKPAPFIVSQRHDDVDMVTVVTEGIFSYCGAKVKIDTDRHLGPERSPVRVDGEPIGHVTTGEYGSQMLSLGGVNHLTGGSKKEGRVTCEALLKLCNRDAVSMTIDEGAQVIVQAGKAPVVNGVEETLMRVGCGSATIGMFARQWQPHVDEVVVVDDHITGVLSEHQAGRLLAMQPTGIRIKGRRSTPGRYFQVAEPGAGWGGTAIDDPLAILDDFKPKQAWAGLRMLMVSTTGEQWGYYELDDALVPIEKPLPEALQLSVERIAENCEPSMCSVLFMGGAGGSLRAGVTENPVKLTRSVRQALTRVSCGGAPAWLWPGGGITIMVDVMQMPRNAFGYVPTPALVAPIEFTLRLCDYAELGGHMDRVVALDDVLGQADTRLPVADDAHWPLDARHFGKSPNSRNPPHS